MNEMTKTRAQRRRFSAEERAQWVELYERSGRACASSAVSAP